MNEATHISQDDLALYAMQALSPEESAAVAAHLPMCAACRAEIATASGDLALIAMSVEQHELPLGARERFLSRIAAGGTVSAPNQVRVNPPQRASVVSIETRRRSALSTWVPWAAAAALAFCAVGLELEVRSLRDEVRTQGSLLQSQTAANARAHDVMDLLTAPHAQHVMLTAAVHHAEPTARAIYMPSKGALMLQASNMAPVPAGKMYELWVIPMSGAPVPAGMFKPDATGSASLVMPQIPKGISAKAFGVTMEDEAGSATPTMPILLSGAAPSPGE